MASTGRDVMYLNFFERIVREPLSSTVTTRSSLFRPGTMTSPRPGTPGPGSSRETNVARRPAKSAPPAGPEAERSHRQQGATRSTRDFEPSRHGTQGSCRAARSRCRRRQPASFERFQRDLRRHRRDAAQRRSRPDWRSANGACQGGWMIDPGCAALEPIFWLHHANIDRLWNAWIALGGGRANPTDSSWSSQSFSFYDERGGLVPVTWSDVIDTAAQLDYVYDDHAPAEQSVPVSLPPEPTKHLNRAGLAIRIAPHRSHGIRLDLPGACAPGGACETPRGGRNFDRFGVGGPGAHVVRHDGPGDPVRDQARGCDQYQGPTPLGDVGLRGLVPRPVDACSALSPQGWSPWQT
jgi:hypothetical protein